MSDLVSTLLELAGLAVVVAGVFIWAGTGLGLVTAGVALVLVGVAVGGPKVDDERP